MTGSSALENTCGSKRWSLAGLLLLALAVGLQCRLARADAVFPGYVTTMWQAREGAPVDINAMAQTPDGWVWLGTSSGLYRFDGRRFYQHDVIADSALGSHLVTDLSVGPNGELWVIYGNRSATRIAANGTLVAPAGLPREGISSVFHDADGQAMVSANNALYVLRDGRWVQCSSPSWTPPQGSVQRAVVDRNNGLVVITDTGLFRLPYRSTRFSQLPSSPVDNDDLVIAHDGTIWRTLDNGLEPVAGEIARDRQAMLGSGAITFTDSDGRLWSQSGGCNGFCGRAGGTTTGLNPMRSSGVSRLSGVPDGFVVMTAMADSGGNIWIGGKGGLIRLRGEAVSRISYGKAIVYFAVAPLGGGDMLVATDAHGGTDAVWRRAADGSALSTPGVLSTTAMATEAVDRILLGGHGTLARYQDGQMTALPVPAFVTTDIVQQLLPAGPAVFWASVRHHGLYLVANGQWKENGGIPALPNDWPDVLAADGTRKFYAGYADGRIAHVDQQVGLIGGVRETGLGTITAISPGTPLLVGGEHGLAWFDGTAFRTVTLRMQGILRGVTGIARTSAGDVWVNGRGGLVHLRASDVAGLQAGKAKELPFDFLGEALGMPGGAQQTRPLPTLTLGKDDMLWVAATSGLVQVSAKMAFPSDAPSPAILSITTSAQTVPPEGATLGPDETTLGVAYTGLSLSDPDHIQFRYRLVGADDTWRLADAPGDVQYAHLAPATYRFEIQARGPRGDWSAIATSGPIERRPSTVESTWFHTLVVVCIVLLLVALYGMRIRALHRRAAERATARLAERDRIARELHDSMLQGMMGVTLRLEAWRDDQRVEPWMRPGLAQTTQRLLGLLLEGRARVIALRSVGEGRIPLSDALRLIGEDHAVTWPARFTVSVSGEERILDESVHMAVIDILREAVHNAFLHAEPSSVAITLDFNDDALVALVDDDGKGLPDDVRAGGRRQGHWGMVTMRERASRIGAQFIVTSDTIGTSVSLVVPTGTRVPHGWFRALRARLWPSGPDERAL